MGSWWTSYLVQTKPHKPSDMLANDWSESYAHKMLCFTYIPLVERDTSEPGVSAGVALHQAYMQPRSTVLNNAVTIPPIQLKPLSNHSRNG